MTDKKYYEEIPLVMRNCIKGLNNEKRQSILIYVLKKGTKSFMDIQRELNIEKNNLAQHLKILMRYGLIYNYYKKNEFDNRYSFYEISKLGKRIINILKDNIV